MISRGLPYEHEPVNGYREYEYQALDLGRHQVLAGAN